MMIRNIKELKLALEDELIKNIDFKRSPKFKKNNILLKKISNLYTFSYAELKYLLNNKNNLDNLHIFCNMCGKKNKYHKGKYLYHCSQKCASNDPERCIKIQHTKLNDIDENGLNSYQRMVKKIKIKKQIKYNNPNFVNPEKAKRTCLEKRGVLHHLKLEYYKQQKRDLWKDEEWAKRNIEHNQISKLFNHNDPGWNNPQKNKQTTLIKIGVEHYTQTQEYKDLFKNEEYKNKVVKNRYNTMKENGTYGTSNLEDMIHQFLIYKFKFEDIIPQYKDEKRYNFACDFYIKSLDLFIECHFSQYHQGKPFDINNKKDWISLLCLELSAANIRRSKHRKNQCENIIYTWTNLDVKKLETFKKNNLNYKIFYKLEDFLDWFSPLIDTPDL